jgi:hypothetical protein
VKIDVDQLYDRVESWMKELSYLGLSHWRIDSLEIGDAEGNYWASVQPNGLYDRFRIRFDEDWLKETHERELDEVIVHELLHCAMRSLDQATEEAFDYVPMGRASEWNQRVTFEREGLVNQLAFQIVSFWYDYE